MAQIPIGASVAFHFKNASRDPSIGKPSTWLVSANNFGQYPTGEAIFQSLQLSSPLDNGVWLMAVEGLNVSDGAANPGRIIALYGIQAPPANHFPGQRPANYLLGFVGDAVQGALPRSIPLRADNFAPVGPVTIRETAQAVALWDYENRPHPRALDPVDPDNAANTVLPKMRHLMPCPHDLAFDFITRDWSPAEAFEKLRAVAIANGHARLTEIKPLLNWFQAVGTSLPGNAQSDLIMSEPEAAPLDDDATKEDRVQVFYQYFSSMVYVADKFRENLNYG